MDTSHFTTARDLLTETAHSFSVSFDGGSNEALKASVPQLSKKKFYVYVLELADYALPRARGASPVLYIGEGKKERIEHLLSNTHSATAALRRLAATICPDTPRPARLFVAEHSTKLAVQIEEARCLNAYAEAHGETPPANARWEGYIVGRVLRVVAQALFGNQHRTKCYDWPPETPDSTWVDVFPAKPISKAPSYSLVWRWPEAWGGCAMWSGRLELHGQTKLLRGIGGEPPPDAWSNHRVADTFTWSSLGTAGIGIFGETIERLVRGISDEPCSPETAAIMDRWQRLTKLAPESEER